MNKEQQIKFIEDNYPMYVNHTSSRRIRHDFFKNIQTEIQAYLFGFYAADGSIDEKRKTFRIHLHKDDVEIIYLYKDIISPDARLFTKEAKEENIVREKPIVGNGSIGVDITSTILTNDLVNLGIGYRKTYSGFRLPNIPDNLLRHFIRGYFDGDGCITGYLAIEKGKKDRVRYVVQIDSKMKNIVSDIKDFLEKNDIKLNLIYLKRDDMYRISSSSKKELSKLFDLLYKDSNFYLSRKFNKFNYYVNTEVSQIITDHCNAQAMNDNESNNLPKSVEQPNGLKMCAEPSDD